MNNEFDSRTLSFTDTFGQRFMKEGKFPYAIHVSGSRAMRAEYPFSVKVKESGAKRKKMKQHTVMVDFDRGTYHAQQAELTIDVGDLVLWCCRDSQAPRFGVSGSKPFFSSAQLSNECGYAHAFGLPGEYHWADAYGGKAHGTVRVHELESCDEKALASWKRKLKHGALVMINKNKVEPAEIDIAVGQTVYFAIIKSGGMSITDSRFLQGDAKWDKQGVC